MPKFSFLPQKDSIINDYNNGLTYVELAKKYGNSSNYENDAQNIRRLIVHFLGKQPKKLTPCQRNYAVIKGCVSQGMSISQIAKLLDINHITLGAYIHTMFPSVKFRPDKGNVHYFDTIDTYAKAYIVGFIAADGSLVKTKTTTTLTITVVYEDRAVLDFIKSEIGNTHNLLEIRRACSFNKDKQIHHIRYAISDSNITKALNSLGIYSNKSLTMPDIIDNIPEKFRDAFIIGYFDGDGSVHIDEKLHEKNGKAYPRHSAYISMRGTISFLSGICRHLGVSSNHIHQYNRIATLYFSSKPDVMRFFKCYSNLPFFYRRKYDKFLQRINHPSFDKYR